MAKRNEKVEGLDTNKNFDLRGKKRDELTEEQKMKGYDKLEGIVNRVLTEKEYRDSEEENRILDEILYGKGHKLTKRERKRRRERERENEDDREVLRNALKRISGKQKTGDLIDLRNLEPWMCEFLSSKKRVAVNKERYDELRERYKEKYGEYPPEPKGEKLITKEQEDELREKYKKVFGEYPPESENKAYFCIYKSK